MTQLSRLAAAHAEPEPPGKGGAQSEEAQSAGPLYRAIYRELANDIRNGRYPVMTLLPTELELCRKYNASRHTVREAIRMLTESGMVSRRPGVGTRVEAARSPTRFTQRISQFPDLLHYARNAALLVQKVSTAKLSARLAETLGRQPGETWLHVNTIKTLGDQDAPVACTLIYARPDNAALRADVSQARVSLLRLIEDHYGEHIVEVNQEFSATPISAAMARQLHVAPGTPGLVITRRYYGTSATLLLGTITTFPYNRMKYSMSLNVS